jgi:hypothetical protein
MLSAAHLRRRLAPLALALSVGLSPVVARAGDPQTIAYAGIVAPGTNGATFYRNTLPYGVIARGNSIVFPHTTTNFESGLWRWRSGTLNKLIFRGDALPGLPGQTFFSTSNYAVDDSGRVAFAAYEGAFMENTSGQLIKVTARNDTAPGTVGKVGSTTDLNFRNGEVSFRVQISGSASGYGVYRSNGAALVPAAIEGQMVSTGSTISNVYSFAPPATGGNSSVIAGTLATGNLGAIIKQSGSSAPVVVVQQNQRAPGLATETFLFFADPHANQSGQFAFRAGLSNGGVFDAIFRDRGGGPEFVVGNNSPMPGPAGARLTGMSSPLISNSGAIAFSGYLDAFSVPVDAGTQGLWTVSPSGVISEVARERTSVPGLPGVAFASFIGARFSINNQGQVAWLGSITGTGISPSNDQGIWSTMPNGGIVSVVREGDSVQVTPGVFRTVRSITFSDDPTYTGGAESPWTDDQRLAYILTFTDSTSGIFFSVVPEPGSTALVMTALGALGYRAMRRRA